MSSDTPKGLQRADGLTVNELMNMSAGYCLGLLVTALKLKVFIYLKYLFTVKSKF